MAAITKAYAAIAEGQLHLRCRNTESDKLPLVLLHASPASSRSLEPLMAQIGKRNPLYAFDTPGTGQSCMPAQSQPMMEDYANILSRGASAIGVDRVALYGTHTGAHIAIEWALAERSRVAALVLDGVALFDDLTRREFLEVYAPPQEPDPSGAQFHWAWNYIRDQMIFFPHYKKDLAHLRAGGTFDPGTLHQLTLEVLNNLRTYHQPYEAVFRHEVRDALSRIAVPVLILSDAEGPLQDTEDELRQLMPKAQLARNCHGWNEKAAAITKFLVEIENG